MDPLNRTMRPDEARALSDLRCAMRKLSGFYSRMRLGNIARYNDRVMTSIEERHEHALGLIVQGKADDKPIVCRYCLSEKVQDTAWINMNTGEIDPGEPPTEQIYCESCCEVISGALSGDDHRVKHCESCDDIILEPAFPVGSAELCKRCGDVTEDPETQVVGGR